MDNDMISTDSEAKSGGPADVSQLVSWFEESELATAEARRDMDRDVDFYDGKQLTQEQVNTLKRRGQPPIVINQIKPEIDYLAGVEKSQRVDPKAHPRTPQDEPAAYVATQGLRFVVESEDYDKTRSANWKSILKAGITAAFVGVRDTKHGRTPTIKNRRYDRFFYDAHSSELDFSDARYMGFVTWSDVDDAATKYGEEYREQFQTALDDHGYTGDYDDKPNHLIWGDRKRKRVRIVEIYYLKGGTWYEAIYSKGVEISNRPSPYIDEDNQPENPIIAQTAYIDRENNRYGQIREMIDPQSDYNKRRSKATHLLNTRQVIADKGAVDDPNKARRDLAQPDAWIEKNPGKEVDFNSNAGLDSSQFQLMQEAGNQLRSNSIKNAMIGGASQSGRAKQSQQQAAMIEIGDLLDNLRSMDKRIFQAVWNRIKQFWDTPRWIRITDDPNNVQHLGLNIPTIDPQTGQQILQNPVAEMNVDLRIEDAPDVTSLQGEDFDRFVTLVPQLAQMPPQWAQIVVELMPHSPGKERVRALLEQMSAPQEGPPPDPAAEEMKKLAVMEAAAKVDEIQSKTTLNVANAAVKQQEAQITPMRAAHEIAKDQAQMQEPRFA